MSLPPRLHLRRFFRSAGCVGQQSLWRWRGLGITLQMSHYLFRRRVMQDRQWYRHNNSHVAVIEAVEALYKG
jgi:hypothetical protein